MATKQAIAIRREKAINSLAEQLDIDLNDLRYRGEYRDMMFLEMVDETIKNKLKGYKGKMKALQNKIEKLQGENPSEKEAQEE